MGYVTRRGDKNKTTKITTIPQKAVRTENWERQGVGGWVGRRENVAIVFKSFPRQIRGILPAQGMLPHE